MRTVQLNAVIQMAFRCIAELHDDFDVCFRYERIRIILNQETKDHATALLFSIELELIVPTRHCSHLVSVCVILDSS
jgi:hypothetical protein